MKSTGTLLAACLISASVMAHEPVVVGAGSGRVVPVPFHPTHLLLSEADSAAAISVYEFVVPPKTGGAPPHIHSNEDEYAYVLDGTLGLLVGDKTVEAPAGSFAALTRGHVHAFWNASDTPVKTLFFVSKGGFEKFFDEVAVSLRNQPPENPMEANKRVGAIAAAYDIKIRPDLIPAAVRELYTPK